MGLGVASVGATKLSISAASPWKMPLFRTINLEKSRVPYVPSRTGWMNGFQSLSQTVRKLRRSRAVPFPRESQTAPQKRDHNHAESSSVSDGPWFELFETVLFSEVSDIWRGEWETMARISVRS